jgi:predicted transcriptional regulator
MTKAVSTKLTDEQRMVLQYIADKNRTTPSKLIREAVLQQYPLDSVELRNEALSFFGEGARHVKQSERPSDQLSLAPQTQPAGR